jgi:hypothetical protein
MTNVPNRIDPRLIKILAALALRFSVISPAERVARRTLTVNLDDGW